MDLKFSIQTNSSTRLLKKLTYIKKGHEQSPVEKKVDQQIQLQEHTKQLISNENDSKREDVTATFDPTLALTRFKVAMDVDKKGLEH